MGSRPGSTLNTDMPCGRVSSARVSVSFTVADAEAYEAFLASKLIGQLHHCLAHHVLYDDQAAWGKHDNQIPQAA